MKAGGVKCASFVTGEYAGFYRSASNCWSCPWAGWCLRQGVLESSGRGTQLSPAYARCALTQTAVLSVHSMPDSLKARLIEVRASYAVDRRGALFWSNSDARANAVVEKQQTLLSSLITHICWMWSFLLSFLIPFSTAPPVLSSSFQFHECWWDSLIIDMLGANVMGMVLGLYTLRFLETRTFDWNQRDGSTKLARSLVSKKCVKTLQHNVARTFVHEAPLAPTCSSLFPFLPSHVLMTVPVACAVKVLSVSMEQVALAGVQ